MGKIYCFVIDNCLACEGVKKLYHNLNIDKYVTFLNLKFFIKLFYKYIKENPTEINDLHFQTPMFITTYENETIILDAIKLKDYLISLNNIEKKK